MLFAYEILINAARDAEGQPVAKFNRLGEPSYQDGDPLVRTWRGEMRADTPAAAIDLIVARHNSDDRPDGQIGPSFSSGDVVVLTPLEGGDRTAFASMNGRSMDPIDVPVDYETDRSWRQVVAGV